MREPRHPWLVLLGLGLALGAGGCDPAPAGPATPARLAPELPGGLTWLNSPPLQLADLRGRVVLLDFFEYSCVNCIRTFPYLQEWHRRYGDQGLVIVGVHTPQYGFSMDPRYVYAGTQLLNIQYPVVLDSDYRIADAYDNRFWPRKFVIDAQGRVRFDHTGEGAYEATERMIQQLLREIDPQRRFPPPLAPVRPTDRLEAECYPITGELYLGHLRGRLGNEAAVPTNAPTRFTLSDPCPDDTICLTGQWSVQAEYVRHTRNVDELIDAVVVRYRATEINAVLRPDGPYWLQVYAEIDGHWVRREEAGPDVHFDEQGRSYLKVDLPRMYAITADQPYSSHELRLYSRSRGLSVYSFSFGTTVIQPEVDRLKAPPEAKQP
ncbi:redoxin domain-containing protein [bacterium]|nr:redoxin domain-containing protein [bacterium]